MKWFLVLSVGLALCCATASSAGEQQKKADAEKLPAPKRNPPSSIVIESSTVRTGSMEVWQHYGVGRLGRFVPRVIMLPEGAYYSRDLQPYPWPLNRSNAVMPYAVD